MVQGILELFTSREKAEAILTSPMIELIFIVLFVVFILTVAIHLLLFVKLKKIRQYVKETGRMDMEPLKEFRKVFDNRQQEESINVETFVQERFSDWRVFHIPVIHLIKMIQSMVSVFILLGVLGTFIGLTISLSEMDISGDAMIENVAGVLSGIDVAFYTSIVGMSFSLVTTLLIKILNTEYMLTDIMLVVESLLEGDEQHGMNRLIDVSETIHQAIHSLQETNQQSLQEMVASFTGFRDYTTGLEQSAKDLAAFNEGLSGNLQDFQELFQQMKIVTEGFSAGTNKLNENFASLFTYFKKADRKNERMIAAFEHTNEKVQDTVDKQVKAFINFEESMEDLKGFVTAVKEEQESIRQSYDNFLSQQTELVDMMNQHNQEFKRIFGNDVSAKLGGISSHLGDLRQGFNQLGGAVNQLPQALEVINQTQAEYKHLLSNRFQELEEFNRKFSRHLENHRAQSIALEKHIQEASNTYEQLGVKNNQLIQEIQTTTSQANQSIHNRERELDVSVGVLKDSLSNYISSLEGTLGDRLDHVVRQFGDSMDRTGEGMKREVMDIGRMTEEMQRNYFRSIQQLLQELGREFQSLHRELQSARQLTSSIDNSVGMNRDEF